MNKILMNDFSSEPEELLFSIEMAIKKVIRSGQYVLGPNVDEFEHKWAEISGLTSCIGVANGVDAIEIALSALDLPVGSEVITTPLTAVASVVGIMRAGLVPVLADVDPRTGLMSLDSAARCIGEKTKAILLVHLYGQMLHVSEWRKLADHHNLKLVEDCAQSHLASEEGKFAGTVGDASCFSFYPTKNLGAIGDAGMVAFKDKQNEKFARKFRNYGQASRYEYELVGSNSRLDEIQAAILLEKLKWLPGFISRRREIASTYLNQFSTRVVIPLERPPTLEQHVYHLFVVRCEDDRQKITNELDRQGIQTLIHYPTPIHKSQAYGSLRRDPSGLGFSEEFARVCLSLPCHPQMTDVQVSTVIDALNEMH